MERLAVQVITILAVLSGLLILVAYYQGVKTDAGAFGDLLVKVGNTFTGRNQAGQFAAYPKAA